MTALGFLLCGLEALFALCIILLCAYVLWWAITKVAAIFELPIPPRLLPALQVLLVLFLLIVIVRALVAGDACGFGLMPSSWRVR